jgi:DNA helicase-2/ATP-dependent DNA helicase PcrA
MNWYRASAWIPPLWLEVAMYNLTPKQLSAIAHPARTLQILACAGSGKTEVLARRAVRLLREGADPSSVIAFTFTEKAAAELKSRIETRAAEADGRFRELPPVARGMFIGTTHAWALEALRQLGGIYETVDALTDEQEWALLYRFGRRLGLVDLYSSLQGKPTDQIALPPAVDAFLASIEVVHDERIERQPLRSRAPQFAEILERYEWLLQEMRVMPFRLMIARAVDELADGGGLRARLQNRISHVLVDEYQDFNRAQDQLLHHLADAGATITTVGDDDQAIYQWRGGDLSLFTLFPNRYSEAKSAPLAENFRCRPEIVKFSRELVEPLGGRLTKILEPAREPSVSGAVEVFIGPTAEDEARTIASRIQKLLDSGHQPADIAVLYRSVRTSAPPLLHELRSRGIPVAVIGKTSLLARPEMAFIARLFVFWAGGTWYPNPDYAPEVVTKESLLAEIQQVAGVNGPGAAKAVRALEKLGERIRKEGVSDSVPILNEILAILGLPGSGEYARWRELGLGQMSELLTEFDHAARRAAPSRFYTEVPPQARDEADEDSVLAPNRCDNRKQTVLGAPHGEIYLIRLKAFLEQFSGRSAEETPDTAPGADNAVQIMTVHQAKGLEFLIVFVPALIEGRFPSQLMGTKQEWYVPDDMFDRPRYEGREDDEARLLYVALTRAKELLVISWFEKHKRKAAVPSRFLTRHLKQSLALVKKFGSASPAAAVDAAEEELLDVDFSSLVIYQECGHKYWLRYICGFQPPLAPELGYGKLLHHVVAELSRNGAIGITPTDASVNQILNKDFYLPYAGPVPASKLRDAALRRLKRYVQQFGSELLRTLRQEARFEVPLENARVLGRIDLMLRANERDAKSVELIDFKTSANRPPSEAHKNQLRLYALAAERMGFEPVTLAIQDLDADKGGRIIVSHDKAERDAFREKLQTWVDGIRSRTFPPTLDKKPCRACDFRRFCRFAPDETRSI